MRRPHEGGAGLSAPWVIIVGATLAAVPVGVYVLERITGTDLDPVMRDTSAAAGAPYYYGYGSTVGVLLWGVAAGASAATLLALRQTAERSVLRFFTTTLILTLLLGLDDGLLLHEEALPARGVPEPLVYAAYLVAAVAWLAINRRLLLARPSPLLAVAILGFGLSLALDFYERIFSPLGEQVLVEDGLKFVGIGMWATYVLVESRDQLRAAIRRGRSDSGIAE